MSGICGIIHFDGTSVHLELLQSMAGAMVYRAHDGMDTWHDGPVGFVHAHFWTTPEDVGERQPLASPDGRLVITADARVDNRGELIPLLTAAGHLRTQTPTDAEVILAAYEKWGDECAKRVIGDFAFAVWDMVRRRLFLARDVIGIRQIYYAQIGSALYFATTIGSIVAAVGDQLSLNRKLIEEYLRGNFECYHCQTVYTEILRLPPSHSLAAEDGQLSRDLYYLLGQWNPHYSSDEEWVDAFRDLLSESIRGCLRAITPAGVLVGGGLDSSSIACIANSLVDSSNLVQPAFLYAAIYDNSQGADERQYFDAVAQRCRRLTSRRILADDFWAFRRLTDATDYPLDEPEVHPLGYHTFRLFSAPRDDGCRIVLTGEGANQVLAYAMYWIPIALRDLSPTDLLGELPYYQGTKQHVLWQLLSRGYLKPHVPQRIKAYLRSWQRPRMGRTPWVKCQLPTEHDSRLCKLPAGFDAPPGVSIATLDSAVRLVRSPYDSARLRMLDVQTAYAGVEPRFPFLDRRIVDFLLCVPRTLQSWRGYDRIILRKAMDGVLPESVRLRRSKVHLMSLVRRGFQQEEQYIRQVMYQPLLESKGFADLDRLVHALSDCLDVSGPLDSAAISIGRTILAEEWLRSRSVP